MRASNYVGRVGSLAVSLGVGAVIVLGGTGIASAAPDDASAPRDANATTPDAGAASHPRGPQFSGRGRAGRSAEITDPPQPHTGTTKPAAAQAARGGGDSHEFLSSKEVPVANDSPAAQAVATHKQAPPVQRQRPAVDVLSTNWPPASIENFAGFEPPSSTALPVGGPLMSVAVESVPPHAALPVMAAPTSTPAPAGALVESVLAPLLGGDRDTSVDSPVSWVMLAAARRQIGAANAAIPAAAAVSTGQVVAPAAASAASGFPAAAVANRPPVINSVTLGAPNTSTGAVSATVKAIDPDGKKLTYKAASSAKGKVTISSAGVLTYTPTATARHAAARVGATPAVTTDTVTVTVTDSKGAAVKQAVIVPISPKNSPPTATKTVGTPNAATGVVTGTVKGTDSDKDTLTYSVPATSAKGTVSITSAGEFTYTPTPSARNAAARSGASSSDKSDTFTVTVADGYGGSVAVPVTVTISPKALPSVAVAVGKAPSGVAVSPDGRWVYTANNDNTVSVVDTATNTTRRTIEVLPTSSCGGLCTGPSALVVSPDGSRVYATGGTAPVFKPDGSLDYNYFPSTVTVIDTASGAVVDVYQMDTPDGVHGGTGPVLAVSPDGRKVYSSVNGWGSGIPSGVKVVDTTTKSVGYIGESALGLAASADGTKLYLASSRSQGVVSAFDTATNDQLWAVRVGTSQNPYDVSALVASPDNTRLYAKVERHGGTPDNQQTGVAVIDVATHSVIAIIPTHAGASFAAQTWKDLAVSPDGKRVYLIDSQDSTLSIIDTGTNTVIDTKQLGANPSAVAVSPDGKYVYVTEDGHLSVIPV